MQQSLVFYDAILAHDHPAYLSLLRFSLVGAKRGTDMALVKLYIVTLTFLPINIWTSMFGMNVNVPHNGNPDFDHNFADGSKAPHNLFIIVALGSLVVAAAVWLGVWLIFRSSRRQAKRRGPAMR